MPVLVNHLPPVAAADDLWLDGNLGTAGDVGRMVLVGSEKMLVLYGLGTSHLFVERAVDGTTIARHVAGDAVTTSTALGGGGGGGVTVEAPPAAPVAVTNIVSPGATFNGATVTLRPIFSQTDPGAVGAGQFWVQKNAGEGFGQQLWVRNESDDDWLGIGPIIAASLGEGTYQLGSPDGSQTVELDNESGRITLFSFAGTAGTFRIAGNVLTFNGGVIGTQAAHVADGSTVDQLRNALIASGLMAAS